MEAQHRVQVIPDSRLRHHRHGNQRTIPTTRLAMRTIVQMAHRSDRREGKPKNLVGIKARSNDWLLARGFHFGQEGKGPFAPNPLHSQAGDTSARLTYRCQRRRAHPKAWKKLRIRGPTLETVCHRPFSEPRCSRVSRLPSLRSAAAPAWTRAALRGYCKYGRWANGGSGQSGFIRCGVTRAALPLEHSEKSCPGKIFHGFLEVLLWKKTLD